MDIRKTRTCEQCRNVVSLDKIRLLAKDESTSILVCSNCEDYFKTRTSPTSLGTRITPLPKADYLSYSCDRCHYEFRADRFKADVTYNLKCPYCGKTDKLAKV